MLDWLKKLLSATDAEASLKHAAYAVVIVSAIGWLTWDMIRGPITSEWNVAFGLLLGAVTTAKVMKQS